MMLQKVFDYTKENTYSGIAKSIYGRWFEVFVDVIQFLYSIGTCCGYAIIIANELYLSVSFIVEGKVVPSGIQFLTGVSFASVVKGRAHLAPRVCHHLRDSPSFPDAQDHRSALHLDRRHFGHSLHHHCGELFTLHYHR